MQNGSNGLSFSRHFVLPDEPFFAGAVIAVIAPAFSLLIQPRSNGFFTHNKKAGLPATANNRLSLKSLNCRSAAVLNSIKPFANPLDGSKLPRQKFAYVSDVNANEMQPSDI